LRNSEGTLTEVLSKFSRKIEEEEILPTLVGKNNIALVSMLHKMLPGKKKRTSIPKEH
jgi:hypothetical protein